MLVSVLFVFGCKKEHAPSSTTGTPIFYFNGTIGGVSMSIDAGINNYYMYSSYTQDTNHVYNFIGDLKQITSSHNSIQIQINDYKVSVLNASTYIDSSLMIKNYFYFTGGAAATTTVYNVQCNPSYSNVSGSAQTYNWNFGDGTTSTSPSPLHTYTHLGYYNVCLTITGSNSCSNSICDTLNLSSPTAFACNTTIFATVTGYTVAFTNTSTGIGPIKYLWNFGDTASASYDTSSQQSVTHNYSASGIYQVSLNVTDTAGNKAKAKYSVAIGTATSSGCLTNYSVIGTQSVVTTSTNSLGLANVIVKWTDAVGNIYTSDNPLQPAGSNFQIISVDNYQNNENNQTTKKLHVKFNCWVYNSTHPPIQITNADAVIAVAYK